MSGVTRWLRRPRPSPQVRVRLICLPYAGGGASVYRMWQGELPPWIDACAVQLPGREDRLTEPARTSIGPLVHEMAEALSSVFDRPFALFGHSMGGILAFELARHLRRLGCPEPSHLFVSARSAPGTPSLVPPVGSLTDADLVQMLRTVGGTSEDVLRNQGVLGFVLPTFRADLSLCEGWAPGAEAPLGCPISAFGGLEDPYATRDRIEGWRAQTSREFRLRMMPGGHLFLHAARGPLLSAMVEDLRPLANKGPTRPARGV